MMNRPTRFYSSKQEDSVAKAINGKKTANSGATKFQKGDVITEDKLFLLECKTCVKEQKTFTLHKEWFTKNKDEAFEMGIKYNALVFNFGDGINKYVIDEKLFKYLYSIIRKEELQND